MLHLVFLTGMLTVSGMVVDYSTGKPLKHVEVASAPRTGDMETVMGGTRPPAHVAVVQTDDSGRFEIAAPGEGALIDAYGDPQERITFHGVFERTPGQLVIRLIRPTAEERAALDQVNEFRNFKANALHAAPLPPLVFDENLMETARYWARMELQSGRIGHTCSALHAPAGCVEFNSYFHALPGSPADDFSGQNAAFDSEPTWNDSLGLFENEGIYCMPAYDWRRCGSGAEGSLTQTGHFKNLMMATRWVGLGKASDADGSYFAQNII